MKTDRIIYGLKGNVGYITLNNPSKLNCMGVELLKGLNAIVEDIKSDLNVKVVVFQGAGERAFSTGADLKEFQALSDEESKSWIILGNDVFNKIEALNKPTIAYINGYALGGGLELALACDFRIGTETAVLGSPELEHGWLPGWGGMTRLRRLLGEVKAKEMIMMCEKLPATKALQIGLLTKITKPSDSVLDNLIQHLADLNPAAFVLAKTALQNPNRTTMGNDVQFDILAMNIVK